jgi:hypothetical protein
MPGQTVRDIFTSSSLATYEIQVRHGIYSDPDATIPSAPTWICWDTIDAKVGETAAILIVQRVYDLLQMNSSYGTTLHDYEFFRLCRRNRVIAGWHLGVRKC